MLYEQSSIVEVDFISHQVDCFQPQKCLAENSLDWSNFIAAEIHRLKQSPTVQRKRWKTTITKLVCSWISVIFTKF